MKNLIKETSHEIKSAQNIINYTDTDIIKTIKELFKDYKGFKCLSINSNADQFYNISVQYELPEVVEDLEASRYLLASKVHQFRLDFFSDLSKYFPIVNANLTGSEVLKNDDKIKFNITLLFSNTRNREWATGRVNKLEKNKKLKESKMKNNNVKRILEALEKRVIIKEEEALTTEEKRQLNSLGKQHKKNVEELKNLEAQIKALNQKISHIEENSVEDKIIALMEKTGKTSIKTGKIIIELDVKIETGAVRNSPAYKTVVEKLKELIATEKELIEKLVVENTPNKQPKVSITKKINVTEKRKLKEVIDLQKMWDSIKSSLKGLFKSYFQKADELEKLVKTI